MIVDLEQYKKDRAAAKTPEQIREFARRYCTQKDYEKFVAMADEQLISLFHAGPNWEAQDLVTMRPWRLIDKHGAIVKEFRSFRNAIAYQDKYKLAECRVVENKW